MSEKGNVDPPQAEKSSVTSASAKRLAIVMREVNDGMLRRRKETKSRVTDARPKEAAAVMREGNEGMKE